MAYGEALPCWPSHPGQVLPIVEIDAVDAKFLGGEVDDPLHPIGGNTRILRHESPAFSGRAGASQLPEPDADIPAVAVVGDEPSSDVEFNDGGGLPNHGEPGAGTAGIFRISCGQG